MASSHVTGVSEILRGMGKARSDAAPRIADGLAKCAAVILKKSQTYVPVDLGPLKASGRVTLTGTAAGARATVEYGGETAPYALWVHEDMTKTHDAPTCAKFLERATRETRGTCSSIMKREMGIESTFTKDGVGLPAQYAVRPGEYYD